MGKNHNISLTAKEKAGRGEFWKTGLRIIVCTAILWFIISRVDLGEVYQLLSRISIGIFILAFLIYTIAHLLFVLRWRKILQVLNIRAGLGKLIPLQLVGLFFNLFLFSIGGEIVRAYYLSKDTDQTGISYLSVFIDRYLGLFSVIAMAALATVIDRTVVNGFLIYPWVLLLLAAAILLTILLSTNFAQRLNKLMRTRFKAVQDTISLINNSSKRTFKNYSLMLWTFAFSIGFILLIIAINYILINAIGKSVEVGSLLVFIPLIAIAAAIPISIGGLGLREGTYIYLFATIGFTAEESLSLALLNFALLFLISLPGAFVFLFIKRDKGKGHRGNKVEDKGKD